MADTTIKVGDGSFTAYVAAPKGGSAAPGILVIQEIFGVNQVMRDLCDNLAGQGYLAMCPDLFWRQEPGIQITDKTEAEWARAFPALSGLRPGQGRQGSDRQLGSSKEAAGLQW